MYEVKLDMDTYRCLERDLKGVNVLPLSAVGDKTWILIQLDDGDVADALTEYMRANLQHEQGWTDCGKVADAEYKRLLDLAYEGLQAIYRDYRDSAEEKASVDALIRAETHLFNVLNRTARDGN